MSDNDYQQLKVLLDMNIEQISNWVRTHIFIAFNQSRNETNASTYVDVRSGGKGLNRPFYDLYIRFGSFMTISVAGSRLSQKKY